MRSRLEVLVHLTHGNLIPPNRTHLRCQTIPQREPVDVITFIESDSAQCLCSLGHEVSVQLGRRQKRLWCAESQFDLCLKLNKSVETDVVRERIYTHPLNLRRSGASATHYINTEAHMWTSPGTRSWHTVSPSSTSSWPTANTPAGGLYFYSPVRRVMASKATSALKLMCLQWACGATRGNVWAETFLHVCAVSHVSSLSSQ